MQQLAPPFEYRFSKENANFVFKKIDILKDQAVSSSCIKTSFYCSNVTDTSYFEFRSFDSQKGAQKLLHSSKTKLRFDSLILYAHIISYKIRPKIKPKIKNLGSVYLDTDKIASKFLYVDQITTQSALI